MKQSLSVQEMTQSQLQEMGESELKALKRLQPLCQFYGTPKGCYRKSKCRLRHDKDDDDFKHTPWTPHVSFQSGVPKFRVPLMDMLQNFAEEQNEVCRVASGASELKGEYWICKLQFMTNFDETDEGRCQRIKNRQCVGSMGVTVNANGWPSLLVHRTGLLVHATTAENGLNILNEGKVNPTTGIRMETVEVFGFQICALKYGERQIEYLYLSHRLPVQFADHST